MGSVSYNQDEYGNVWTKITDAQDLKWWMIPCSSCGVMKAFKPTSREILRLYCIQNRQYHQLENLETACGESLNVIEFSYRHGGFSEGFDLTVFLPMCEMCRISTEASKVLNRIVGNKVWDKLLKEGLTWDKLDTIRKTT